MVHLSSFRTLSMRGMLHPINQQHNNCRHSWIHFYIYPYSEDKFRGLSMSINHRHYLSLGRPKTDCYLHFIWRWYKKFSKTDHHTSQPHHLCTKPHQDNNHYYLPLAHIATRIKSTITRSCTPPCTSSEGGLRHCISSEGGSTSTTITSKINTQAKSYRLRSSTKK